METPEWTRSGLSAKRKSKCIILSVRPVIICLYSYDTARQIKESQDAYCSKAMAGEWSGLGDFPEDLQWEALVDVLRGRVKVCERHWQTTTSLRLSTGPHPLL